MILGHAGTISADELASAWVAPPLVIAAAVLGAALFAQAFVRLRRRGRADHAPASRAVLFALGLTIGVLALVSPLDAAADDYLLSAHMLQHVLIVDLVPLLVLLALRGPLTFFFVPRPALRRLAPLRPVRGTVSFLLRPWVSFVAWAVVILAWHVPAAYDATLRHPAVHELEHALFLLVGLLAWAQLVDPARHGRLTRGGRILFAIGLLAFTHPIIDAMVFSSHPLYAPYAEQHHRLFGLSPLTDQRLAGLIMFVEQLLTVGTCVAVLLWPYLRARRRTAEQVRAA